jgi:hypothetical protein
VHRFAGRCRVGHELSQRATTRSPGESVIIGEVDRWLAREFAPHRPSETIRDLAGAPLPEATDDETQHKIAECGRKLAQYRAVLGAGASPATVATWIAETEAEWARYELSTRPATTRPA